MSSLTPPDDFELTHGDSIHTSDDPKPHLTGTRDGSTDHVYYNGQTTIGMYDRSMGGHRLGEVKDLHDNNPGVFEDSGLDW